MLQFSIDLMHIKHHIAPVVNGDDAPWRTSYAFPCSRVRRIGRHLVPRRHGLCPADLGERLLPDASRPGLRRALMRYLWIAVGLSISITSYGYFTSPEVPLSQVAALSAR